MTRKHEVMPFSKACNISMDVGELVPFYTQLDHIPDVLDGQHPIRRWEYAMALRTIDRWRLQILAAGADAAGPGEYVTSESRRVVDRLQICDVGGAGSNFWKVLHGLTTEPIILIDPSATVPPSANGDHGFFPCTVEDYAASNAHGQFDILTSLSVIEHVDNPRPFLRAIHMLLKKGGLLFLTTDYWGSEGPDVAHFHWMRKRIYNAESIRKLLISAREVGFRSFGEADWSYPGPQLYDYSVASIALVKK